MSTIVPPMKWAQRKESVFITVTVPGMTDCKVEVNKASLSFSGSVESKNYAMTLEFFKEINPEISRWSCTPRCVQFHLVKDNDETWSQLLKDKNQYKNLLKIDWDLWADSDDEEDAGMNNFQLPPNFQEMMSSMNMQNSMNYPSDECGCGHDHCGCGHDHCECESESDDEDEMPPLEEVN